MVTPIASTGASPRAGPSVGPSALSHAEEIYRFPARVAAVRAQALPKDVSALLRQIVEESGDSTEQLNHGTARSADQQEVIGFYIEQILLHPEADAYRILGATPDSSRETIRANMALLLRWLHPDRNQDEDRTIYMARVLEAWEKIKTTDRRENYDRRPANAKTANGRDPGQQTGKTSGSNVRRKNTATTQHKSTSPSSVHRHRKLARREIHGAASPAPTRRGFFYGLFKWIRRLALVTFAVFVLALFLAPGEMMPFVEYYWNEFLAWLYALVG